MIGTEDDTGGESDNVIQFPAPGMRPSAKLSEAWSVEVEAQNKRSKKQHKFISPIDAVGAMMKMRGMPTQPWPAEWPEAARRARTYVGECNAYVGAIGAGKTQKAIQLARAVSGAGLPVVWANLELGVEQLIARILGNMNGVHAMNILDDWPEAQIRHQVSAVTDMWHFVDRYDKTEHQIEACRDIIDVCHRIYRLPCLFIVDHIGQLLTEGDDTRREMLKVGKQFEKLALDTKTWGLLLAQGTKSGQQLLTGRVEVESAADAIGAAAESSIMQQVCSNVIVGQLYKEDDAEKLSGRDLYAKCRWTGKEGQVGSEYSKPGGVWRELDYLPQTPGVIAAEEKKQKADKNRTEKPQSTAEIRQSMNATSSSDASAQRRARVLEVVARAGSDGVDMRTVKVARSSEVQRAMGELARGGVVTRLPNGRWRLVPR